MLLRLILIDLMACRIVYQIGPLTKNASNACSLSNACSGSWPVFRKSNSAISESNTLKWSPSSLYTQTVWVCGPWVTKIVSMVRLGCKYSVWRVWRWFMVNSIFRVSKQLGLFVVFEARQCGSIQFSDKGLPHSPQKFFSLPSGWLHLVHILTGLKMLANSVWFFA